ncbi:MAG: hypothetical protein ACREAM_21550 [Blastocatellia bacterium]
MKLDVKDGLKFIALCGLKMAVISGAAFAQQPAPTVTPTSAPDVPAKTRGAENERTVSLEVSILLERLERLERKLYEFERLERRLNELESRFVSAGPNVVGDVAPTAPTLQSANAAPQNAATQAPAEPQSQLANAAPLIAASRQQNFTPPMSGAASQPMPQAPQPAQTTQAAQAPTPPPPYAAWDKDGVKIIPFGILIANVNYNSSALVPGSWAAFALPKLLPDQDQFNVSPGNTYLGIDFKWPKIGEWEINGKVDFNLRGAAPLTANNIFAPQFIHVYGEARTERYRILAGQTEDVVAPLIPNTLNQYPITFMPGSLGYFRPQARFDTYQPIGDNFTFIFQGAVTQAIQTLDVGSEVFGRQTGLPDGQARVALGYGKPAPNDPLQKRPFELGLSGHLGQRRGDLLTIPIIERDFTSWSGTIDLTFKLGKVRFDGEYFGGSVLGDYAGGIFQTFNPDRGIAIRATGAWAQLTYDITDKWQLNGGYGRDDPYNRDLSFGQRSLNEMGFGNVFYRITPRLWVALELSRWRTKWVDLPTGSAFRVEPAVLFFF